MTAPTFTIGQAVIVSPPMTPCARHRGQIVRKAKHGWRVRFDAWGMMITETMPESALMRVESVTPGQLAYEADVRARPLYHDGTPRRTWHELGTVERWSWERNPTDR